MPFSVAQNARFRQFRGPIIRVIEYKGRRKAMANQALAWNLAAETAKSGNF